EPQVTLYSTQSLQDALVRWGAAEAAASAINALGDTYFLLGNISGTSTFNSNSVASTLIASMGLIQPIIPGASWDPGQGSIMLSSQVISNIQAQNLIPPWQTLYSYDSQGKLIATLQQVLDSNGTPLTSVSTAYTNNIPTSSTTGIFNNGILNATVSN